MLSGDFPFSEEKSGQPLGNPLILRYTMYHRSPGMDLICPLGVYLFDDQIGYTVSRTDSFGYEFTQI